MKLTLALMLLICAPLSHADDLDDLVLKGANLFLDKHHAIIAEEEVVPRAFCDSSPTATGSSKCNPQEMVYEKQLSDADKKLSELVPGSNNNNFLKDAKTLSHDDLLMRAFWDKETVLEIEEDLKTCLNSYCTDANRRLKLAKASIATDMDLLRKMPPPSQPATAAKVSGDKSLAEMKGATLTLDKGDFGLTDKSDIDHTGYKIAGACTATVKFSNFDDFAKMYTGKSDESSWTVGPFLAGYDVDSSKENWPALCKLLDGQKTQAECLSSVTKKGSYHVPDSVVLSSTDGLNRMTIYSSDSSRKDEGVRDCLKAQNFKGLADGKQVAKDSSTTVDR